MAQRRLTGAVRGVVFDLDGTLIDSRRDIVEAANHALEAGGFERLPASEIESYVGDGARLLLARAARVEQGDARLGGLLAAFLDYYAAHPLDHTTLMPGVSTVLAELARLKLAVCTNKPRITTVRVLDGLKLTPFFSIVVAGDDLVERKPSPLPIQHIAGALGIAAERLVVVGDGAQDVLAGRRAGARTVGVEGGIQPLERLLAAEPDAVLTSLSDLPELLRVWSAAR